MITAETCLLTALFLAVILHFDPDHGLRRDRGFYAAAVLLPLAWGACLETRPLPAAARALYGLLGACLATAAITDHQTKKVHDFLPFTAFAGGLLMFPVLRPGPGAAGTLAGFLAMQFLLFRRMYGLADCFVFSACAAYLAAAGRDMTACLAFMGAVFLALAAVQALRRNINTRGNLKEPVALVPYISAVFWFFM